MSINRRIKLCLSLIAILPLCPVANSQDPARPNVLFIAIDDLRPTLGCYGDKTACTPNIDHLAGQGTVFFRAYCQQAVCGPSRLSLLTGRRPDTIRVWDLATHFREALPDAVTLPQHFKNHGYHTQSIGKIFHGSGKPAKDPRSWSVAPKYDVVRDPKVRYALPENLTGIGFKRSATESAKVVNETYIDGKVCNAAIQALSDVKQSDKPFFLAVGFRKPHLPFCAPEKYWKSVGQRTKIPVPLTTTHPKGAPEPAIRSWNELEGYSDIPKHTNIPPAKVQELRHGYYACVSYIDHLVGNLLYNLKHLELRNNTVVVIWSDHGFHLGEQGLWTKANNYELSTRVPLIISVPGQKHGSTKALAELVDLYPTLADVCGLDAPVGVEGVSLKPLIENPNQRWKQAVFSQYPRARSGSRHRGHGDIMGYAVRTDRYRYVEWQEWESKNVVARELYDHETDPHEMQNVAEETQHTGTVKQLAELLRRGWKSALPEAQVQENQ